MSDIQVKFISFLFETPVNYDGIEELIKNEYHPDKLVEDLIDSLFCSIDYTDIVTSLRLVKEAGGDFTLKDYNGELPFTIK